MQAMSLQVGAVPMAAPVMPLHPLRQQAPMVPMPEVPGMMGESYLSAHHAPAPPPADARSVAHSGLFAEPRQGAMGPGASEAARPSLFSQVTGAFRRRGQPAATVTAGPSPVRPEPLVQEAPVEAPRASVRQTAGDEVGLDIPAFLRRQSS
jgi:cell division protein FtsZ